MHITPKAVMLSHFGLMNMGWQCSGGKHVCDDCPHDPDVPMAHAKLGR